MSCFQLFAKFSYICSLSIFKRNLIISLKMEKKLKPKSVLLGASMDYNSVVIQFRYPGSDTYYTRVYSLTNKKQADEAYNLVLNHRDYGDIQGFKMCEKASRRDYYVRNCGGPYKEQVASENSDDSDDSDFVESEDDDSIELSGSGSDLDDSDDDSMADGSVSNESESNESDVEKQDDDAECESGSDLEFDQESESGSEKKPPPKKKQKLLNERKKNKKSKLSVARRLVDTEDESGSDPDMPDMIERETTLKSKKSTLGVKKRFEKSSGKRQPNDEVESDSEIEMVDEKTSRSKKKLTFNGKNKKSKCASTNSKRNKSVERMQVDIEVASGSESDVEMLPEKANPPKRKSKEEQSPTQNRLTSNSKSRKSDDNGSNTKEGVGKAKDVTKTSKQAAALKSDDSENGKKKKKQSVMELNSAYDEDDDEEGVDLSALAGE